MCGVMPAWGAQNSWSAKFFQERNLHSAVPAWLACICFLCAPRCLMSAYTCAVTFVPCMVCTTGSCCSWSATETVRTPA